MKKLILFISLFMLAGCGNKHDHTTFCMLEYHQSLYDYRKESTDENATKHIKVLEGIILHANEAGIKTPPGIYLEKGYFKSLLGNTDQAEADYQEEMSRFPETKTFIEKVLLSTHKPSAMPIK